MDRLITAWSSNEFPDCNSELSDPINDSNEAWRFEQAQVYDSKMMRALHLLDEFT